MLDAAGLLAALDQIEPFPMAVGLPVPIQILGELAVKSGRFQAIRFAPSRQAMQDLN
jgi:hypothetical protein